MVELKVELGARSYPIFIGEGLLNAPDCMLPYVVGDEICIVTNDRVAPLYLATLERTLAPKKVSRVILPDGEAFKNLDTLNRIFDGLLEQHHSRNTTLVALGGGVVGDMTGFAAACYQRGVAFVQVPTTLLSQVDSSVGGKTGVNHPLGKNMIGAFHQPRSVVIDTDTLKSLPARELSAGLAEVIKYGLIYDADFFAWLETHMDALRALDTAALTYAIERSCAIKAEVVAADEREGGIRAWLNLGHTFGHAIENQQGYGAWLHGEAVGAGMLMAATMSHQLDCLDAADLARIEQLVTRAGLPTRSPPGMTPDQFLALMQRDKKVEAGRIRLVLLRRLGQAVVTGDYDDGVLRTVLNQFCTA